MKYAEFKEELLKAVELANVVENERDLSTSSQQLGTGEIEELAYTENEKAFSDFVVSLSEDTAHAIQSVMYIGKDGARDYSGNADTVITNFMEDLSYDDDNWIAADVMLGKAQVATFLKRGMTYLDSL